MIPQSVLIGIVVAIAGYFLQQRAWRHKTFEETKQRETEECLKIADELGKAIDRRLMALSAFRGQVDRSEVSDEDFKEYKDSVKDWMHSFSAFKTKIYHYFGRDAMLNFENRVHRNMRNVSEILLRTHRLGKNGLSREHAEEHADTIHMIEIARFDAFRFLREINERISNGEIGRTALYNRIEVGDLDLISKTYLIQRLFGLKS